MVVQTFITMKTFVLSIIRDIQEYSQKLDNLILLTNYHWVMLDGLGVSKTTYFFRENGDLIISVNGKVEKSKWEYLDKNSILISIREQCYLFRHGFFDENIMALKIDGKDEYAVFINESKYDLEIDSIDEVTGLLNKYFLNKYLSPRLLINEEKCIADKKFIKEGYTIKMGWFKEYRIKLITGGNITVYQKVSNGKYFIYSKKHILLFQNKIDCMKYLEMEMMGIN